jgi:hypothetical protein
LMFHMLMSGMRRRAGFALASAAAKIFNVLANMVDPERVFSELVRMISSARTSLVYKQSSRMLLIATDYRANEH